MNYFIDFEANQFSNEIISIGCVRENGDQFYSLINPKKKITEFITNLTGITNELLQKAENSEEVFQKFFEWCNEYPDDIPTFYCYGNSDTSFVKANFNKAKNFKEKAILGYLFAGLRDYAPFVQSHFGLVKLIGLNKVYNYYTNSNNTQRHNALDDALMLKYIFDKINNNIDNQEDINAFPEYKISNNTVIKTQIVRYDETNYKIIAKYDGFDEAIKWIKFQTPYKERARIQNKNLVRRIKNASQKNTLYCKCYWKIMEVKE